MLVSASHKLPSLQTAVKQGADGSLTIVHNAPVMTPPDPNNIIVRVAAVGLNPTDHKLPAKFPCPGATAGTDFAGTIVDIGSAVNAATTESGLLLRKGQRVCGSVFGSNPLDKENGAFSKYVQVPAGLVARVPDGMTWEEAAALGGVGHTTVALALWSSCLDIKGRPDVPVDQLEPRQGLYVLVYGGSTATGTMAMQILALSGYKPIAVCSPHNFHLAQSFGAVATFDYKEPDCAQSIRAYTSGTLWYAIDCVSDDWSAEVCQKALGRAGGRRACLELQGPDVLMQRKSVKSEFVMQYEIFGRPVSLSPHDTAYSRVANPGALELGRWWYKTLEDLLEKKMIRPHPVRKMGSSWDSILESLEHLRRGEISGEKLVVELPVDCTAE